MIIDLKQAMKRDLITRNVACLVAAPKPKNARNGVLEPEEWTRLYDAAPAWFKSVLLTGYHTGCDWKRFLRSRGIGLTLRRDCVGNSSG
ncbi:hypothetical protein W02_24780 [Nitrospira sp. KM1]|uniref:hypothetical protein n=1 Tax=Nitrospira sp. KM1 TaxID=1936990 RepID=UPI0013A748B1|nr:hypothetical protein [Nitrospira sp. KM1]BCA55338.1 hypothetical protein W02_24780 [Nitrospira sp. KM1]